MLFVAATPIGNLGDASPRLRDALGTAAVIAAEDTRHTGQLLSLLGVTRAGELLALHEHNERARAEALAKRALDADVVLVSDAGMPTVSDPGFALVRACHDLGVQVTVIPGPSAVLAALAVAGLPTDRFTFEGFLPRKAGERARRLASLVADARTLVFFESPHRIAATLADLAGAFGSEQPAAVCRELTKLHEEVRHGSLGELASWAETGVRGEIVIVVGGSALALDGEPAATQIDPDSVREAVAQVLGREVLGERLKVAAKSVAANTNGITASELYAAAVEAKGQGTR